MQNDKDNKIESTLVGEDEDEIQEEGAVMSDDDASFEEREGADEEAVEVIRADSESAEAEEEPQVSTTTHFDQEIADEGPHSWMYFALTLTIVLVVIDFAVQAAGQEFFWSDRAIYTASFVARALAFLIANYLWHGRLFSDDARKIYIVSAWVGFLSGIVLSIIRFIQAPLLWTFLNLVAEPIDGVLIALAMSYIVYQLTKHKTLTPSIP